MSKQGVNQGSRGRHPLVSLLRAIRKQHKMSQLRVEVCMELPINTLRHIERGRRPLPRRAHGLSLWIKRYLDCVKADTDERKQVVELMSRQILVEFSELLEDV